MTLGTTTSFCTHNATNDGQSSGGNAGGRENRESKVSLAHGKRARKRNHRYLTSGRRPCRIECEAAIDERSNPSLETAHVIKKAAQRLAKEDGVSLNQWIASAVAQKVGVVETAAEFFNARAGQRHRVRPDEVLAQRAQNQVRTKRYSLTRTGETVRYKCLSSSSTLSSISRRIDRKRPGPMVSLECTGTVVTRPSGA
jgi:hypothetical protein